MTKPKLTPLVKLLDGRLVCGVAADGTVQMTFKQIPYIVAHSLQLAEQDQALLKLFDEWTIFKKRFLASARGSGRDSWTMAMIMLCWRLMDNTDALRMLCTYGRPNAGHSVYRSMYEGWLNLLLIGFHEGAIDPAAIFKDKRKRGRRSEAKQFSPTKRQIARRFIAFGWHVELQTLETVQEDPAYWASVCARTGTTPEDAEAGLARLKCLGARARAVYEFSDRRGTWLPFRSVHQQWLHIWPDRGEGNPLFPRPLFPGSGKMWRAMFWNGYKVPGHFVHGSSASHGNLGRQAAFKKVLVEDGRHPDAILLQHGLILALIGTAAFADAMGMLEDWNETIGRLTFPDLTWLPDFPH